MASTNSYYADSIAIPKADVPSSLIPLPSSIFKPPETPITRTPIHDSLLPLGFVLHNVFSKQECQSIVESISANVGWSFYSPDAAKNMFRSCDTVETRHNQLASALFARIQPYLLDAELHCNITEKDQVRYQRDLGGNWIADNTVDLVLFSKYGPGGHFAAHTDGFNIDTFDRRSLYSIVLYLNDVEKGGETVFFHPDAQKQDLLEKDDQGRFLGHDELIVASVQAKAGTAAIFFHNYLHQSNPTVKCEKYILRSDIMYQRHPPLLTTEKDCNAFKLYLQAERLAENSQMADKAAELFRMAFKQSPTLARIYGS